MDISNLLNQTLTYWAIISLDGYGKPTFDSPDSIMGRFEYKMEAVVDGNGDEFVSRCVAWVDQDVEVTGYLFEGTSTESDPTVIDGAYEIKIYRSIPDLDGTVVVRKAWM